MERPTIAGWVPPNFARRAIPSIYSLSSRYGSDQRRPNQDQPEGSKMKDNRKLTPKGARIVAALERFRDTVDAGVPVEQRYTVRRARLNLTPRTFGPEEVKVVRASLGISQSIFGQFLGVDVKPIRSGEQGQRAPSGMACRFLEEIQSDINHWRGRLREVLIVHDVAP